jgi:fumarate hydratase, class II
VNTRAGRLPAWKGDPIERVCDEVIAGKLDADFSLYVWHGTRARARSRT